VQDKPKRAAAALATAALLLGAAGCGHNGSKTAGPAATSAAAAPDLGFAITPSAYGDPYTGALDAAAQAPAVAQLLARGIATARKLSGDAGTPAADLAADLTALLSTHVYAVGSAVSTEFATERHSAQADRAWAAVEANSKALIHRVESLQAEAAGGTGSGGRGNSRIADPTPPPSNPADAGKPKAPAKAKDNTSPSPSPTATEPPFELSKYDFGKAWREHVGLLTDYALAARSQNTGDQRTARRELDTWRLQAGQYFRAITHGRISSSAVRSDLGRYLDGMTQAIDGIAAKDGESFVALRESADQMPGITQRLAAGLAAATDRKGSVYDKAAQLRNELTATMTGHSYLAVMSFQVAFAQPGKAGLVSAQYRRVQVSLDDNSKQIADQIQALGGPVKQAEFLQGWRIHLRDLENYARSLQVGDLDGRRTAVESLNTYLDTVTAFLKGITGGAIDPAAADKRLRAQLAAMIGVVDALQVAFPTP
jgi:hypothetical protein